MRLVFLAAALAAFPAYADLYRWVDPETGSVKFSTLPPPWVGDPDKERRSPPVEVVPFRGAVVLPNPPAASASTIAELEARRAGLLQSLATLPAIGGDASALRLQLQAYQALSAELDRLDPAGAARRRAQEASLAETMRRSAQK